jgi:viroplasmin and RNaseH domain-containing protein
MDSYSESKFLNDFMKIYQESGEYNFTILFDDYYCDFISNNTTDFLKTVYQYYYNIDDDEIDEEVMFQTLYSQIEVMICDKCESEADTDTDE